MSKSSLLLENIINNQPDFLYGMCAQNMSYCPTNSFTYTSSLPIEDFHEVLFHSQSSEIILFAVVEIY